MANDPREKEIADRESAKNKQVEEFYAREAELRPTPSQYENDRAKLGLPTDEKEPDGSEPEAEFQQRVMEGRLSSGNPYVTREASPDQPSRRGRPRKAEGE